MNAPKGEETPNDVLKLILPGKLLSLFKEKKKKDNTEDVDQIKSHKGVFAIIHSARLSSRKQLHGSRDVIGA